MKEMIQGLNHIAIIVSSENSISFYKRIGFKETDRERRTYDELVLLEGYGVTLEIFVDSTHPPRVDRPEAMGLRHMAFTVDDLDKTISEFNIEVEPIREKDGKRYTFFKDPDGLPIELKEITNKL